MPSVYVRKSRCAIRNWRLHCALGGSLYKLVVTQIDSDAAIGKSPPEVGMLWFHRDPKFSYPVFTAVAMHGTYSVSLVPQLERWRACYYTFDTDSGSTTIVPIGTQPYASKEDAMQACIVHERTYGAPLKN
jgi:hypothetical protein